MNRGTAYHPSGKIYIQLLQGELAAIDAKSGKELWKAKHPDHSNARRRGERLQAGRHDDQRPDRDRRHRHRRHLGW